MPQFFNFSRASVVKAAHFPLEANVVVFWIWNALAVLTLCANWLSIYLIRRGTPDSLKRPYGSLLIILQVFIMFADFTFNIIRPVSCVETVGSSGKLTNLLLWLGNGSLVPVLAALTTHFLCSVVCCFGCLAISQRKELQPGIRVVAVVTAFHLAVGLPIPIIAYFVEVSKTLSLLAIFFIVTFIICVLLTIIVFRSGKIFTLPITPDGMKKLSLDFRELIVKLSVQVAVPIIIILMLFSMTLYNGEFFNAFAATCASRAIMNLALMLILHDYYQNELRLLIRRILCL